jgi:hypothetical protein
MSESQFEKVSVTLPRELVTKARSRVGSGGLSAHVAEGLRLAEHLADLDEFLAAREVEHGPIPDEIMQEVREAWPDPHAAAPNRPAKPRKRSS